VPLRDHLRPCGLPSGAVEHQTLFRTAEGISRALSAMGWPVRDYVPLGELIPGMAYLVRRILENSSQVGFLLQSRSGESAAKLLAPPVRTVGSGQWAVGSGGATQPSALSPQSFRNHPPKRLFLADERRTFAAALDVVKAEFEGVSPPSRWRGRSHSDGRAVRDPSHPDQPALGLVHTAGATEVGARWRCGRRARVNRAPVAGRRSAPRRGLLAERRDITAA
jgi:RHH-type proline utilization regulon transcriptional repressor/proline dehydrogenase/delta 1-pyrroline-5-carboxylate dehydrogenase